MEKGIILNAVMMTAIYIIGVIFQVYMVMLFIRVLGSWIPEIQNSRFMQFISFYTDPYLNLFRKIIPPLGMVDISPIIAFLALGIIEKIVITVIMSLPL